MSKYAHVYVQQNSILEANPSHFSKVVYAPDQPTIV